MNDEVCTETSSLWEENYTATIFINDEKWMGKEKVPDEPGLLKFENLSFSYFFLAAFLAAFFGAAFLAAFFGAAFFAAFFGAAFLAAFLAVAMLNLI